MNVTFIGMFSFVVYCSYFHVRYQSDLQDTLNSLVFVIAQAAADNRIRHHCLNFMFSKFEVLTDRSDPNFYFTIY